MRPRQIAALKAQRAAVAGTACQDAAEVSSRGSASRRPAAVGVRQLLQRHRVPRLISLSGR